MRLRCRGPLHAKIDILARPRSCAREVAYAIVLAKILEFGREDDGPVDCDRETAVAATQHDGADDELRERPERTGERVVGLPGNDESITPAMDVARKLTLGKPRLRPTVP